MYSAVLGKAGRKWEKLNDVQEDQMTSLECNNGRTMKSNHVVVAKCFWKTDYNCMELSASLNVFKWWSRNYVYAGHFLFDRLSQIRCDWRKGAAVENLYRSRINFETRNWFYSIAADFISTTFCDSTITLGVCFHPTKNLQLRSSACGKTSLLHVAFCCSTHGWPRAIKVKWQLVAWGQGNSAPQK